MPVGRSVVGMIVVLLLAGRAEADGPSRFVVPKTKEEWAARRPRLVESLRETVLKNLPPVQPGGEYRAGLGSGGQDFVSERFWFQTGDGRNVRGRFLRRTGPGFGGHRPAVILLADNDEASRPVLDGADPAMALAARGMAVLWIEVEPISDPWSDPRRWPQILRDDTDSYGLLLSHFASAIDPDKIAVLGVGLGGTRAVWLAALHDRIGACIAIGGMTRLADWTKAHPGHPIPPWMAKVMDGMDLEALVALCGGRPFAATAGDRDPSCPVACVQIAEETGKALDDLTGRRHRFSITRLGRQDEHYNRLPWMGAMEVLDKAFSPQGPTPLGHDPEPEPEVTSEFVDLAANGIAGWAVEMSQRPTTWTWKDGVISCRNGPNEYGWLRAPVEVGDFVLSMEWKVQRGGNTGIFLRAKPVPWTLPPSTLNKRVVSTRGLDWPSRTGLELQAQDDPGIANKYSSGSLYRHAGVAVNPTNPPGQWNRYTVRARGPRVEVWSNGQQVLDARIDECPLTLAEPPMRGYIGLQNHGAPAEFRNVKLRRLD